MAGPAENGAEFAFVVDHVGPFPRRHDGRSGSDHRCGVLVQGSRLLGYRRVLHLLQMGVIVQPRPEHEAGVGDRREQARAGNGNEGACRAELLRQRPAPGEHLVSRRLHEHERGIAAPQDAAHGCRNRARIGHHLGRGDEVEYLIPCDHPGGRAPTHAQGNEMHADSFPFLFDAVPSRWYWHPRIRQ